MSRAMQPYSGSESTSGPHRTAPKIAILLATYNGETYLAEQLQSILAQSHRQWFLYVSDDGSNDQTLLCLKNSLSTLSPEQWELTTGPGKGFASNFLHLMRSATGKGDYFACCDQDDIWHPDKLARALTCLKDVPPGIPAAYFSRSLLVDSNNQTLGASTLFSRQLSFNNALVQSIGGGNTLVMNDAARRLVCSVDNNTAIASHDWWAYIAVTGCGGQVFFDNEPTLRYRQHSNNLSGQNNSLSAKMARLKMLFDGVFKEWNDINLAGLSQLEQQITAENRRTLNLFKQARQGNLVQRLHYLSKSKVYRQKTLDNLLLYAAAILNLL